MLHSYRGYPHNRTTSYPQTQLPELDCALPPGYSLTSQPRTSTLIHHSRAHLQSINHVFVVNFAFFRSDWLRQPVQNNEQRIENNGISRQIWQKNDGAYIAAERILAGRYALNADVNVLPAER
jgi:hypothetical protein